MCFNKEVSIASYIVSSTLSILLLLQPNKTKKHIGLYLLLVAQVQLMEYFMWLDQSCSNGLNHTASNTLHLLLLLQPMIICIGAIRYQTTTISNEILWLFVLLSIIPITYSDYLSIKYNRKLCSKQYMQGHLNWDFQGKPEPTTIFHNNYLSIFYLVGIFAPWFFIKDTQLKYTILVLLFGSLGISLLFNKTYRKYTLSKNIISTWESLWCFLGSIAPVIIYFI